MVPLPIFCLMNIFMVNVSTAAFVLILAKFTGEFSVILFGICEFVNSQINSLGSTTNQLSTTLAATQTIIENLNQTLTNTTIKVS